MRRTILFVLIESSIIKEQTHLWKHPVYATRSNKLLRLIINVINVERWWLNCHKKIWIVNCLEKHYIIIIRHVEKRRLIIAMKKIFDRWGSWQHLFLCKKKYCSWHYGSHIVIIIVIIFLFNKCLIIKYTFCCIGEKRVTSLLSPT